MAWQTKTKTKTDQRFGLFLSLSLARHLCVGIILFSSLAHIYRTIFLMSRSLVAARPTVGKKYCLCSAECNLLSTMSSLSTDVSSSSSTSPPSSFPSASSSDHTFRKAFHIPSAWATNPRWSDLQSHTYAKKNHTEAVDFVSESLKLLGYEGASLKMKRDYLAHLLSDILQKNGIPHLTAQDFTDKLVPIQEIFSPEGAVRNPQSGQTKLLTPDLFIKSSSQLKSRSRWLVVDVYMGDIEQTEAKYAMNEALYDVVVLNARWFPDTLKDKKFAGLVSEDDIHYLQQNFKIFEKEWQYWRSCLALSQILFNDTDNVPSSPSQPFTFPADYEDSLTQWIESVMLKLLKIKAFTD